MTSLHWIFDGVPASGARHGGLAQAEVFDKDTGTFVREVLQNALDQRLSGAETVRVRFRLEELSGTDLSEFKASMAWSELEPHLDAVADAGYVTISGRVRDSLEALRSTEHLRLLRIDDSGTNGLTGGEDEPESNFNALCRHTLITAGARRESGGSFGLGKSVLWRFSGFSTVLFASLVSGNPERPRYFGRTLLAWHSAEGGEWEGSGWLGETDERPSGIRARSIWDEEATAASDASRMTRDPAETGTSIMIVGFDDPSQEDEPSISSHCAAIVDAAAKWFWPALVGGEMEVYVEGLDDSGEVYARQAHPGTREVPFVLAQASAAPLAVELEEPGQIVEVEIPLSVPAQRPESFSSPRGEALAHARLRVRLAESGEEQLKNTIALQRGTGMVIQYLEPPRVSLIEQPFHATLVAGTAHGDTDADRAAEEFLRSAEPVAHSEWTTSTDRLRNEFAHGAQTALRLFLDRIGAVIHELLRPPAADSQEAPEALRRLFPLPTAGGGSVAREPYRLSDTSGFVTETGWEFAGTFYRANPATEPWQFRVGVHPSLEDGASREFIPVVSLHADPGRASGPEPGGWWEVTVPPHQQRVRFQGRTSLPDGVPHDGLHRAGIRLDVRPLREFV